MITKAAKNAKEQELLQAAHVCTCAQCACQSQGRARRNRRVVSGGNSQEVGMLWSLSGLLMGCLDVQPKAKSQRDGIEGDTGVKRGGAMGMLKLGFFGQNLSSFSFLPHYRGFFTSSLPSPTKANAPFSLLGSHRFEMLWH